MPYHTGNGNGNGGQMRSLTGREEVDAMRTSDTTSAGERSNAIKLSRNSIVNTRTPNVYIRETRLALGKLVLSMSMKGGNIPGKMSLSDFVTTVTRSQIKVILSFNRKLSKDIINKITPLTYDFNQVPDAREIIVTGANLNFSDLESLYRSIDSDRNEYYEVPFEVVFEDARIAMENPKHLTCIAFSYSRDLNEPFGSAKAYSSIGRLAIDGIIDSSQVVLTKSVLKTSSGKIWAGEYHKTSRGVLRSGSPGLRSGQMLTESQIPNLKIKDERVFAKVQGFIEQEIPVSEPDQVVDVEVSSRVAEFSNLYLSLDKHRNANLMFGIDCREIFLKRSKHAKVIQDEGALQRFMMSMKIKSIDIYRREIQTNDRLTQGRELIVSSQDVETARILQEVDPSDNKLYSASIQEIYIDGKISRSDTQNQLRYFTVTDYGISSQTDGQYQYEIDIEFEENTEDFLRNITKTLRRYAVALQRMVESSSRSYNVKSKRYEQSYAVNNAEAAKADLTKYISSYIRGLSIVTDINKATKQLLARTLMNMTHPITGSTEGLLSFKTMIEKLITLMNGSVQKYDVLSKGKKDPDSQATSLKNSTIEGNNILVQKRYSKAEDTYNITCVNSTGKDYLFTPETDTSDKGLAVLAAETFETRIAKEQKKFPGSAKTEEIISDVKEKSFNYKPEVTDFTHITPEYVQIGDNLVDLNDDKVDASKFAGIDTLLTVREKTLEINASDERYYENSIDSQEKTVEVLEQYIASRSAKILSSKDIGTYLVNEADFKETEENLEASNYTGDDSKFNKSDKGKDKFVEETITQKEQTQKKRTNVDLALALLGSEKPRGQRANRRLPRKGRRKRIKAKRKARRNRPIDKINDSLNIEKESNIIDTLNADELTAIPNQIMGLVKNPPKNFRSPNPGNAFVNKQNFAEFKLKYGAIQSIEILTGYGASITDEAWRPLTRSLFQQIRGAALMRLRPYTNAELGITETYNCPVFNEYFIVGEPAIRQQEENGDMSDTMILPVPKLIPPEFLGTIGAFIEPSRVRRCRASRVPGGAEREQEEMIQAQALLPTVEGTMNAVINNLYTPGKEFTLPNGTDYVGYYHVHPTEGAMVGRFHTPEPHSKLTRVVSAVQEAIETIQNAPPGTYTTSPVVGVGTFISEEERGAQARRRRRRRERGQRAVAQGIQQIRENEENLTVENQTEVITGFNFGSANGGNGGGNRGSGASGGSGPRNKGGY